jgi:hypothetical protein
MSVFCWDSMISELCIVLFCGLLLFNTMLSTEVVVFVHIHTVLVEGSYEHLRLQPACGVVFRVDANHKLNHKFLGVQKVFSSFKKAHKRCIRGCQTLWSLHCFSDS